MATIAYLERHHEEKNMHRYYRLTICPTLFGSLPSSESGGVVEAGKANEKRIGMSSKQRLWLQG